MRSRASAGLTLVRALVASLLSVLLAVVAHVSAGGLLPTPWTFALILLLCTASMATWLDREASRTRLALLLIGGQTTIHVAMTALAGHGDEGGLRATNVHGALGDAVHHLLEDLSTDGPMMLAHLAAATLTGVLLGRAERALWQVLGLLRRATGLVAVVLRAVPVVAVARPVSPRAAVTTGPLRLQSRLLTGSAVVRRGPPALLPAC